MFSEEELVLVWVVGGRTPYFCVQCQCFLDSSLFSSQRHPGANTVTYTNITALTLSLF